LITDSERIEQESPQEGAKIKGEGQNQIGFSTVLWVIPAASQAPEKFMMTVISDKSHLVDSQRQNPAVADYVYQGATIIAVLLLVLSAAV
jgi:hypothetical protein